MPSGIIRNKQPLTKEQILDKIESTKYMKVKRAYKNLQEKFGNKETGWVKLNYFYRFHSWVGKYKDRKQVKIKYVAPKSKPSNQ